ncbi:CPBP family intramembrane glutamic endopeptidase [Canibacter zhoujuaniae]|uniref:CPBP family intramembrane glutamic endopeptidase n=1 Tax=Canibacter zhoujuaniae TaxID=2708343 RepID=UPI001420EA22|nr:type II CAAX endopeptidase family protein [Canibacter zhoujuaniae]
MTQNNQPQEPLYPWAQQTARVRARTEPLRYHELWRGINKPRWYKPLVVSLIGVGYYIAISIVFVILAFVAAFGIAFVTSAESSINLEDLLMSLSAINTQHPLSIFIGLTSVALMIPAGWLALKTMGIKPTGRLWSVALKIRWDLLLAAFAIAAVVLVIVQFGSMFIVSAVSGEPVLNERPADFDTRAMWISVLLVLVLVPFQATAEEYVFRGFLLQTFGNWMRNPVVAILLTSALFGAMHIYDIWGMLSVTLLGCLAAYLTIRTGGLEAAMALHIVNNYVAFGFMASGYLDSTSQESQTSGSGPALVLTEIVVLALFWLAVELLWKKKAADRGWANTRVDVIEVDVPIAELTEEQRRQAGLVPVAAPNTGA